MFKVNDVVRVIRCEGCPGVVGKEGRIKSVSENGYSISFGKGRPQRGRPELFAVSDLALVTEKVEVQ